MIRKEDGDLVVSVSSALVFAGMLLASAAIVFVLGVYVGKGIAEERYASDHPPVRVALDTGAVPAPSATAATLPTEAPATPVAIATEAATPVPTAKATRRTATRKPAATPVPAPAIKKGSYRVQVSATRSHERAKEEAQRLKKEGFQVEISKIQFAGEPLYRIRVVNYPTEDAARKAVTQFRSAGYPKAFLPKD